MSVEKGEIMGYNTTAPWDNKELEKKEFLVDYAITLQRTAIVKTNDYVIDLYDDINTDCTDWKAAYEECYYTIPELLDILKKYVQKDLEKIKDDDSRTAKQKMRNANLILSSIDGWKIEDTDIGEI